MPIVRIENLNGGGSFNRTDRLVDEKYRVDEGDLLFGWSGNRGTSFGPFRWSSDETCLLNQHIFRLEPLMPIDLDWLYWALRAATQEIEDLAHGMIGMVHVTKENLGRVRLPLLPIDKQREVASYLNAEERRTEALARRLEYQISLLHEHRQALITAAVTGELEIPGLAA
jgi:type I restriction enzyme S subunit